MALPRVARVIISGTYLGQPLQTSLHPFLCTRCACSRFISKSTSVPMDAKTDKLKQHARSIFAAGVDAVLPPRMVAKALRYHDNCLTVGGRKYKVDHNVYVVGFGKAVIGMVGALESVLKEHVQCGVASVPYGIQDALRKSGRSELLPSNESRVTIIEGAKNNLPDDDSLRAAQQIAELTERLGKDDLLVVLVSGGGSALLPSPIPPLTLQDVYGVSQILGSRGSTISELNTVRKHLSRLKGGGLARLAHPAQVISLILSDIIGNQLDMIASGPTIFDDSTPQDCLDIVSRLDATDSIPRPVLNFLRRQAAEETADERVGSGLSDHVLNVCIGHNEMAAEKAVSRAEELGFSTMLMSTELSGKAGDIAALFVDMAAYICHHYDAKLHPRENLDSDSLGWDSDAGHGLGRESLEGIQATVDTAIRRSAPVCLLGAGETTVAVAGTGKGGRNQEMALAAATLMNDRPVFGKLVRDGFRIAFLSGGTDGQDGPTDAAGALADPSQVISASQSGLDAEAFLRNNDSYSFYRQVNGGKDLLMTGLTGTNVMDIQVLLIDPPDSRSN